MCDAMSFPATVEEFMEQYKIVDREEVYTNGAEMVPIFRMKQWFEHEASQNADTGKMVGDCISRQAAIDKFKPWLEVRSYGWGELNMLRAVINELENMPPVQPKHGKWIKVNGKTAINCSACYHCSWSLAFEDTVKQFNFCPNCGADMRGEADG